MKKWISKFTKDQIQRFVFLGLLVIVFSTFFIALGISSSNDDDTDEPDITNPIVDDGTSNQDPIVTIKTFILPAKDTTCEVVRNYYSSTATSEEQVKAVIQYGKRYFVSTGVALQNEQGTDFEVVASMDGVVESIEESPIYGIVVVIKHDNDVYTEYSSLSSTTLELQENVSQGMVIGVSGTCEYDSTLPSHVYFKVAVNTRTVDPLAVIGKTIENVK